ncbi:MAG: glycosyltransferase, partial [Bacteroidales bacterium]|nr:glycosyltransferase [Bacteroidales bacterium]
MNRKTKIIISGGGSGGHIFPAVSIANAYIKNYPDTDILFIGAEGKMEMEKVPAAGYKIVGLPVVGMQRKLSFSMFSFAFKVLKSLRKAKRIIKDFAPDVVVGVGGYASGPALRAAASLKIPCLIQEQNSYAGVTNKLLAKKASKICVAYDNM